MLRRLWNAITGRERPWNQFLEQSVERLYFDLANTSASTRAIWRDALVFAAHLLGTAVGPDGKWPFARFATISALKQHVGFDEALMTTAYLVACMREHLLGMDPGWKQESVDAFSLPASPGRPPACSRFQVWRRTRGFASPVSEAAFRQLGSAGVDHRPEAARLWLREIHHSIGFPLDEVSGLGFEPEVQDLLRRYVEYMHANMTRSSDDA
jgi:hypothetical protein